MVNEEPQEDLDEAIEAMRETLAASGPGQAPGMAAALGQALAERYDLAGDEGDRDAAITWLHQACDPSDHDPMDDLTLAMLLTERGEERRDGAEIEVGLGHARRCLGRPDDDVAPLVRFVLGTGHLARAEIGSSPDEFRMAVGYLREAAALLPDDSPERAEVGARLGVALAMWVLGDAAMDGAALDEAVALLARAQQEIPPDDAYLVPVRYWLAMAWSLRFMWYAGSGDDIEQALAEFDAMLADSVLPAPLADLCHIFAACLLLVRAAPENFRQRSHMMDPGQAARIFTDPPERTTPDAARSALAHLGQISDASATGEFGSLGSWLRGLATMGAGGPAQKEAAAPSVTDIAASVEAFEDALGLMPEDHPAAGELRGMLGMLYGVQEMSGTGGAIPGRSVESLIAAARQLGEEHPMVPLLQSMLGGAFGPALSGRSPSSEESTAAIDMLDAILDQVPDDHPARAQTLLHLGSMLMGQGIFLDRSVQHLKKLRHRLDAAMARPPASQRDEAVHHFVLGMAEGIEGLLAPDPGLVNAAMDRLKRAADIVPGDAQIQGCVRFGLLSLLCQRYTQDGELQYLDAAVYYAREIVQAADGAAIPEPFLHTAEYLLAAAPLARNADRLDRDQLNETIARMEALQKRVPEGHHMQPAMGSEVSLLQALRGGVGLIQDDPATLRRAPGSIAQAGRAADEAVSHARATAPDDPYYSMNLGAAGNARVLHGFLLRDRRILSEGIALLAEGCAAATAVPDYRWRLLALLGGAVRLRYDLTRDRNDLNNAISRLEEARRLGGEDQGGADMASLLYMCALAYYERNDRNLRDRGRAAALGLSALRERSTTVLLQSTADRAFDAALAAAGEAADVVRWCLADGQPEAAVEALERGRGMVLHAAVADAAVPLLLREAGQRELAAEWGKALAGASQASPAPWDLFPGMVPSPSAQSGPAGAGVPGPELRLPDDLRYRVVRALEGTELERLLAPPPVTEIVQALRVAGARALVYLVPRDEVAPGLALVVEDTGGIRQIPLPMLNAGPHGPVSEFAQAQRDLHEARPAADDARPRWQRALDDLCGWAWTAAMERVLDSMAGRPGRRTRLVLVPVSDLGLVPWHAARRPVADGALRYTCQDAVISYAASARQFTESCRTSHRPWRSAAALVRVPGSRLFFASQEVEGIHRCHYPEGILLGGRDRRSPPATAEAVRALLPRPGAAGVSVLHLGCHAQPAPRPVDGQLLLGDGDALSMRDILHQGRARPRDVPGCLVVLAACGSDLTGSYHDEALTLATSFLAAGAVGAVGARWPVDDLPTLAFMTMFHHYLNSGYDDPSTALRATQSWMLNPDRTFPAEFHPKIAEMVRTTDLARVQSWAAFTYQGQ